MVLAWVLARRPRLLCTAALVVFAALSSALAAQTAAANGDWPMSNRDYAANAYSPLSQINAGNVAQLRPAWSFTPAPDQNGAGYAVKATPLEVGGVLYYSTPDNVWAVDARTGQKRWRFHWDNTKTNWKLGNRGVAILNDRLYFETPDCNLVALKVSDGTEIWHKTFCDVDDFYYGSAAPLIVKNHVIVGVSGDTVDMPGFLASYDPVSSDLQWRWYAHPEPGTPAAKTWPSTEAMLHGGGETWGYKSYDPELNLIYFGTGNAQPVIAGNDRPGANLYTACLIALDPDTGKMAWYFQATPHEDHDWDAVETPVLVDTTVNGRPRKLLVNASRNGWFFILDRTNGKALVSRPYVDTNWTKGVDAKGQPIPDPERAPSIGGQLSNPNQGGAANWSPPAYNPNTGLFYIDALNSWSIYYVYDLNGKPEGWGGNDRSGYSEGELQAIDVSTGKLKWAHKWASPTRSGLLTTAGNLVFSGGVSRDLEALNATTGEALWHAEISRGVSNAPMTYSLDGVQYVVAAAGDQLHAFTLPRP
jgi:alcohol dehydrogenase (cytochrome c)